MIRDQHKLLCTMRLKQGSIRELNEDIEAYQAIIGSDDAIARAAKYFETKEGLQVGDGVRGWARPHEIARYLGWIK